MSLTKSFAKTYLSLERLKSHTPPYQYSQQTEQICESKSCFSLCLQMSSVISPKCMREDVFDNHNHECSDILQPMSKDICKQIWTLAASTDAQWCEDAQLFSVREIIQPEF